MDLRIAIGDKVRYMRMKMRLSQEELALKAGTSQKTICRIEHYAQNTSADLLDKLGHGLGIPTYTLLTELNEQEYTRLCQWTNSCPTET